jgi:hypothetical protein
LGVVRNNDKDDPHMRTWIGTNAEGFAIMNTMSYNLTDSAVTTDNGRIMRRALEECRTVDDFRRMLDALPRPLKVETNYGVIDAHGGAAYFETCATGYRMLDVNDPTVAPGGYLVYTNFSYTGFYDRGQGYIRYQSAQHQLARIMPAKSITPQWIYRHLARTFYHSVLDLDYTHPDVMDIYAGGYIYDLDLIPRNSTASATVVQGVRPGENPELTTLWTALGYPPCAIAVPAWVKLGKKNTDVALLDRRLGSSFLSDFSERLKQTVYDIRRGHGESYLHFAKVYNKEKNGYMQQLLPVEQQLFDATLPLLEKWREAGKLDLKEAEAMATETGRIVRAIKIQ